MKRIRLIFFFLSLGGSAAAQADIQAMLKQIALIAVHVQELEKAIEIAKEGLATIYDIKNGEFNLHSLFFSSLKSVNPAVAKYSKIGEIIEDQGLILAGFQQLVRRLASSKTITPSTLSYVNAVYTHMTDECSKTLNDLMVVLTDDALEMTDDERIRRIDGFYRDMKDRSAFTVQFSSAATNLVRESEKESLETPVLKVLE
jgi:hypothetical protein